MGPLTRGGRPDPDPTPPAPGPSRSEPISPTPVTLVWLEGDRATVARWSGTADLEQLAADIPNHHRSTGRVRHDPAVRHGGGGPVGDLIDRDRLAHRRTFLERVAAAVPPESAVHVLGPGPARDDLARVLRDTDHRHRRARTVVAEPAARMTERQLVARLRELAGVPARRRVVGRH